MTDDPDAPNPAYSPNPTPGARLERLYAEHAAACVLYARTLAGDGAEDAAHEAFVRLMRRLAAGGEPPDHVRAWLLVATRSAALDGRKADARRRRRERAAADGSPAFAPAAGDGLDAALATAALADLPARRREVLVLRLWGGLGFAEIAEIVGVGVSTAHADHAAALEDLRKKFAGDDDER